MNIQLPKNRSAAAIERAQTVIGSLAMDKAWKITIAEHKPTRSGQQNALLWKIYTEIIEKGGEAMAGWDKQDLHEFFLVSHFGSETKEIFGRKRLVPLKRSSVLNKQEFSDLLDYIVRFMAERGVWIDMPGDL